MSSGGKKKIKREPKEGGKKARPPINETSNPKWEVNPDPSGLLEREGSVRMQGGGFVKANINSQKNEDRVGRRRRGSPIPKRESSFVGKNKRVSKDTFGKETPWTHLSGRRGVPRGQARKFWEMPLSHWGSKAEKKPKKREPMRRR